MVLIDTQTGEELEAVIEKAEPADFKDVKKDKHRFNKGFKWSDYKNEEVYKIHLRDEKIILGLMCIRDHIDPSINAIQIELLEVSAENIGKKKKIDHIGGCLIAWACRESYKRGHDGVVFLVPKTGLVEHYKAHYGFIHWPVITSARPDGVMTLEDLQSSQLIRKYLS